MLPWPAVAQRVSAPGCPALLACALCKHASTVTALPSETDSNESRDGKDDPKDKKLFRRIVSTKESHSGDEGRPRAPTARERSMQLHLTNRQRNPLLKTSKPATSGKYDPSDEAWAERHFQKVQRTTLLRRQRLSERRPALNSVEKSPEPDPADDHGLADPATGLQLPPIMRPPRKKDRFHDFRFEPGYRETDEHASLRKKRRIAPFSTAFSMNPYAHMLAEPVRKDGLTSIRLPRSCLLDFHLAEAPESKLELLPLSFKAARVPKKKKAYMQNAEEKEALRKEEGEQRILQPEGAASYLINHKDAVGFISDDQKKRFRRFVLSRTTSTQMQNTGEQYRVNWRSDMAEHVLQEMRKVVVKKIGSLMYFKEEADSRGMVVEMPGNGGLDRLSTIDHVSCVLCLVPPGLQRNRAASSISEDDEGEVALGEVSTAPPNSAPTDDAEASGATDHRSATWQPCTGPWDKWEPTQLPFLGDLWPSAPPLRPGRLYYPTVPYRNRRVAVYHLPWLLGEKWTAALVERTVFRESKYAAITASRGTIDVQKFLFKLQSFLATSKPETPLS